MATPKTPKVHWLDDPEDHDYPAAVDYLSLLMPITEAQAVAEELRKSTTTSAKAKDILRASRLSRLSAEDPHVAKDLKKIKDCKALSPILLVRGKLEADVALTIADGYHRACAAYLLEPDTVVPCRIVDCP